MRWFSNLFTQQIWVVLTLLGKKKTTLYPLSLFPMVSRHEVTFAWKLLGWSAMIILGPITVILSGWSAGRVVTVRLLALVISSLPCTKCTTIIYSTPSRNWNGNTSVNWQFSMVKDHHCLISIAIFFDKWSLKGGTNLMNYIYYSLESENLQQSNCLSCMSTLLLQCMCSSTPSASTY